MIRTILEPPIELRLEGQSGERALTLKFLNKIETFIIVENRPIQIDFSNIKIITASVSLLLFAIVNRNQLVTENMELIRFRFPNKKSNPEGYRWVVKTGLSKALLSGTLDKLDKLTTTQAYFQSSDKPDEHAYITSAMLQHKAKMNDEQFELLSSGISEAMLNVSHHAYENEKYESQINIIGKRWWQCAWFDPKNDSTTFILCDLGDGICETYISDSPLSSNLVIRPEVIMKEALTTGNSRFKGVGRGNGSDDMKRPILSNISEKESLLIFSHRMEYCFSYDKEQIAEIYEIKSESLPGTLIKWILTPKRAI